MGGFSEILIQTGYYFVAMCIGIFLISIIQRGLFWPFVKVRLSFGKLIMVKSRAVHRDYFMVGKIEEGFLVYGDKLNGKRISIKNNSFFYRVCGLMWVDVEDEKGALCKPDYSTEPGFDAVKYNNLYVRTLMRPSVADNQDKIIIGALFLIIVLIIVAGFLVYQNGYSLDFALTKLNQLAAAGKGVIIKG